MLQQCDFCKRPIGGPYDCDCDWSETVICHECGREVPANRTTEDIFYKPICVNCMKVSL